MNEMQKKTVSVLNDLIQTVEDGREGYRQASENVESPEIRSMLSEYSSRRAGFAATLREEVRSLGGEPEQEGTVAGSLHRGWISLKETLSSNDDEAVIAECCRGEEHAIEQFGNALENNDLPAPTRSTIEGQKREIEQARARMESLERTLDATS